MTRKELNKLLEDIRQSKVNIQVFLEQGENQMKVLDKTMNITYIGDEEDKQRALEDTLREDVTLCEIGEYYGEDGEEIPGEYVAMALSAECYTIDENPPLWHIITKWED